ncbi:MAG: phosphoglucosamine mutase [Trueperaceae bacterium]|nr:phosphoglucosamine mutase [Trueperaceae bacterium]
MSRKYFGTDGVRGLAGQHPMTAEFAFKLGIAATEALKHQGIKHPKFTLGMDTRRSARMLAHAMSSALMSRGASIILLDVMPTPGVSYLTRTLGADAGIVISASHNPFYDNGIKFFNAQGEKLNDEVELEIERWLEQGSGDLVPITGEAIGNSQRYRLEQDDYYSFLLDNGPRLKGMHIAIDCAHGASYALAPRLFKALGAKVEVIGAEPDGLNINVDCGSTHPETLIDKVLKEDLDFGIAFDGDADRALLVDRKGRLVTGDHILTICALVRKERAVAATLMSNLGVENYLKNRGVYMIRTKVGDRYVHEALLENDLNLGGEQSGHMLFLDKAPTGDGLLTALQTLLAVEKSEQSLEAWMDDIPLYPQTLVNVKVPAALKATLEAHPIVAAAVKDAQGQLGEEGRINLRPSGTEPLIRVMVEGSSQEQINRIAKTVADAVESVSA